MALLVRCSHCGAPHRSVSARERFVCDYCKGLNVLHEERLLEELVCPVAPVASRVLDTVRLHLMTRGLPSFPVELDAARRLPFWQIVSTEGEECFLPAAWRQMPAVEALRPPAAPLVGKAEAVLMGEGPPAVPLEISREEAEKTALASFEQDDALLEVVRLIWLPVVPLRVSTPSAVVQGLYLGGAERLLLESIPPEASDAEFRWEWVGALAALFGSSLLLGATIGGWTERLVALSVDAAVLWIVLRGVLPGRKVRRS